MAAFPSHPADHHFSPIQSINHSNIQTSSSIEFPEGFEFQTILEGYHISHRETQSPLD
jgi:hypothetical protein